MDKQEALNFIESVKEPTEIATKKINEILKELHEKTKCYAYGKIEKNTCEIGLVSDFVTNNISTI